MNEVREHKIKLNDKEITIKIFGSGTRAIVASNSKNGSADEWAPLAEAARACDSLLATYAYPDGIERDRAISAVIDALEDGSCGERAEEIALIGAEIGGEISLRAAGEREGDRIVGVVAISLPTNDDGTTCCTEAELRMITCPKMMIASEFDENISGTRSVFALIEDPRRITLYPGEASGTSIIDEHGSSIIEELTDFFRWTFSR